MTTLEQAYGNLMAMVAQCMQDGNWAPVEAAARGLVGLAQVEARRRNLGGNNEAK